MGWEMLKVDEIKRLSERAVDKDTSKTSTKRRSQITHHGAQPRIIARQKPSSLFRCCPSSLPVHLDIHPTVIHIFQTLATLGMRSFVRVNVDWHAVCSHGSRICTHLHVTILVRLTIETQTNFCLRFHLLRFVGSGAGIIGSRTGSSSEA